MIQGFRLYVSQYWKRRILFENVDWTDYFEILILIEQANNQTVRWIKVQNNQYFMIRTILQWIMMEHPIQLPNA